jgi:hypothetical protein
MSNLIEEFKSLQELQKIINETEDLDPEDGKPRNNYYYSYYCNYYWLKLENLHELSKLCYSEPALSPSDDL